jgi:hypothetical protein
VRRVPDGDISINYDEDGTTGNLQGNTLGVVAFTVVDVADDPEGSVLPNVRIRIESTANCPTSTTSQNGQVLLVR